MKHGPLSLLKKTSTYNEPTPPSTLINKSTINLWTQNQAPSHPKLNTLHQLHPSNKITDLKWQVKFGNFESSMEILDNEKSQSSLNISRVMVRARESLIQTYRVAQNYKGKRDDPVMEMQSSGRDSESLSSWKTPLMRLFKPQSVFS